MDNLKYTENELLDISDIIQSDRFIIKTERIEPLQSEEERNVLTRWKKISEAHNHRNVPFGGVIIKPENKENKNDGIVKFEPSEFQHREIRIKLQRIDEGLSSLFIKSTVRKKSEAKLEAVKDEPISKSETELPESVERSQPFRKNKKGFNCYFCLKLCRSKYELFLHIKVHTLERSYAYSCDKCNKKFRYSKGLRHHKLLQCYLNQEDEEYIYYVYSFILLLHSIKSKS